MKSPYTLMAALVASALLVSNASAAGFDWEGFYFGVQGGTWVGEDEYTLDKIAGVNVRVGDKALIGVEGTVGLLTDFSDTQFVANLRGRLGLVMGSDVLIYKLVEVGYEDGATTIGLGGGIEFAAGDNLSLRGEVRTVREVGETDWDLNAGFGLLWHVH